LIWAHCKAAARVSTSCTTKCGAQSSPARKSFATRRNISPKRRSSAGDSEIWNIQISDQVTAPVIRQLIKRGHGNM
jgi:hypothetical protein